MWWEHQWHTRLSPRVPLFCSYHILTSSVIYYWTDARQHGIYLLNIYWEKVSHTLYMFIRGFIHIFSKRATVFHRWENVLNWIFMCKKKKNLSFRGPNQVEKKSFSQLVNLPGAQPLMKLLVHPEDYTCIYGLLTKVEVKMAGYWPISFFAFNSILVHKHAKKELDQYPAILTE